MNAGEKGATVAPVDRSLVGLQKDGEMIEPESVELSLSRSSRNLLSSGDQIKSKTTLGYRPPLAIECEDSDYLVQHGSAVVRHTLIVEDNKGAYECSEETDIELIGPRMVREE